MPSKLDTYIRVGVLLSLSRPTYVNLGIALLGGAALLILGGRGPLLFTVLAIIAGFFLYRMTGGAVRLGAAKYVLLAIALGVGLTQWRGAERTLQRFSAMFVQEQDPREGLRTGEFTIATQVIADAPILGVGLGGYGLAEYGIDEDIYPHNLFLEALAETGIVGFALCGRRACSGRTRPAQWWRPDRGLLLRSEIVPVAELFEEWWVRRRPGTFSCSSAYTSHTSTAGRVQLRRCRKDQCG
jgi:O-antigen ligase